MTYFDVVLFSPPSRMINHYRPPIALLYIGGYLTRKGLKVKIIDVPLKKQVRDKKFIMSRDNTLEIIHKTMINEFRKVKTKIVGITCYTPEYFEVLKLAKEIKEIDDSIKIIGGGIHPTLYPEDFFDQNIGIDICVIGEGEITMYELCQSILGKNNINFEDINGIAYFDHKTNKVIRTPTRPLTEMLDDVSYPDYSLIDMDYYTNASPYSIRGCFLRSMYLLATRGCPSQCTFCVSKKLRQAAGGGTYSRVRSAESLIKELKELKDKYKIDSFYFIDDLFTINKNNVKQFCELLKKEKLNLLWGCSSKVSTLNEEILKIMAESGCIQIDFGVERGSNEALKFIKKGISIETIINIFNICKKYKIRTFANMLVNIPNETEKDLDDIDAIIRILNPDVISINIFTPYPGTEIYDNLPYKFAKEDYPLLSKDPVWLTNHFPDKFQFASHNINFQEYVNPRMKQYNKISNNLKFYLSLTYLVTVLKSKSKINYCRQFGLLIKEFINQKY